MSTPGAFMGNDVLSGTMKAPYGTPPEPARHKPVPISFLDLYPTNEDEYRKMLAWNNDVFTAAQAARQSHDDKWERFYKMYRSYIEKKKGDWRSKAFIPHIFASIETVVPRLVAQLPKPIVTPVTADDVITANVMEELLEWSTNESDLYLTLLDFYKSILIYGTGILKTFHKVDERRARRMKENLVPVPQQMDVPIIDPETGQPMLSPFDGSPMMEKREEVIGYLPQGYTPERYTYVAYDGPAAECIDISDFWIAPEATTVQNARYACHRVYREMSYIEKLVEQGIYRWPDDMGPEDIADTKDDPRLRRLDSVGLGHGNNDSTRKPVELIETWTDDGRKFVMANRKALIQVIENPYDHGEKPFIRGVDYPVPHEFWGIGEVEPLEGLQDLHNAIANQRIDAIRLTNNPMYAVNWRQVEDINDLSFRPGGFIRLKGDGMPDEILKRQDLGDVNASAFEETEIIERTIEKVSGVSPYQTGMDSDTQNDTATGVAIIQEQGASRFGQKSKNIELMALKPLFMHFGSILQQFTTEERVIRVAGPQGQWVFQTFDPESLQGALDYSIQSDSTTQTETVRQERKMQLLSLMSEYAQLGLVPPQGVLAALEDVLDSLGVKDKTRYLQGTPPTQPGMPGPGLPPGPGGMPIPGMPPPGAPPMGMGMGPPMGAAPPPGAPPALPPGMDPMAAGMPPEMLGMAPPAGPAGPMPGMAPPGYPPPVDPMAGGELTPEMLAQLQALMEMEAQQGRPM